MRKQRHKIVKQFLQGHTISSKARIQVKNETLNSGEKNIQSL